MHPSPSSTAVAHPRGHAYSRRDSVPPKFRSPRPPFHGHGRRSFPLTPPPSADRRRSDPNFTVELLRGPGTAGNHHRRVGVSVDADVVGLIAKLKHTPQGFAAFRAGSVAGRLFFEEWVQARETVVSLWGLRLDGVQPYDPRLCSSILLPSDTNELRDDLKSLFADRVRRILNGDLVREWRKKLENVLFQITDVRGELSAPNKLGTFAELLNTKKRLIAERDSIAKKTREFKSAMACILNHLAGKESHPDDGDEGLELFRFDDDFCWSKITCLITRECRRLEDGLPIYGFRKEILRQIRHDQITVLIGETGSGKSTQLVQFLADSGIAANESIICTQPRKIAALSLARRVAEESRGCYDDDSVICCPTSSSLHHFDAKVIYMTDHCLLQHYMKDKNLSGISCVIVDEAHERSLNTDLLLALLKNLLLRNPDLRLIIMSATADANQLSEYFFACKTFRVSGRSFPVDVRYVPSTSGPVHGPVASYVYDVLRMVSDIDKTENNKGSILAFLTSQLEVEWACDHFESPTAVSLPLHGKLSFEEQCRVFQSYLGRRKVIFTTNVAETSLTIPGVKYVVDSGLVKESRYDSGSGMNILRVCWTCKSSADQRTGRAGRTESGTCYRLYSESDYEMMPCHQEPEIRRVHLGIAVLRILALGIENCQDFDFIDAPSAEAIDMAVRNLIQLGAAAIKNEALKLTDDGRYLVKLGIEPRLGRLILGCLSHRLSREGLVLAAVMANASSIFCRVGKDEEKIKSDCLKVQFCHRNGDLFTLLSVYKAWEDLPREQQNKWCWENSINAKSMRRCQDTLKELEQCLETEVSVIIPSYWRWNPHVLTDHDKNLKKVILSSLAENVAVYSGYDRLGYEVAFTGQNVQLHPSCSLLMFSQRPQWVVFSEILSISCQYLVCVTAFDHESLLTLSPPPPEYDISKIESRMLEVRILTGFGTTQLKRFCGKFNSSLFRLLSIIRTDCMDVRIGIEVNCDQNGILVYARSQDMDKVISILNDALEYSRKLLHNECLEKCLYNGGPGVSPSIALFGAGAQIKHLELEKRYLTVDISYSNVNSIDDREILSFFEKCTSGSICGFHKLAGAGQENEKECSVRVTFLTPDAAKKASELNGCEFRGSVLRVNPRTLGIDNRLFSFPYCKAKVYWPRRPSNGFAIARFDPGDVSCVVEDFLFLLPNCHCERGKKEDGSVVISKLDKSLSEDEILTILRNATNKTIHDFFLVRGDPVGTLPHGACEEALFREISPFMPRRNTSSCCRIQVFPPEPKDYFMKGEITFDGRLHLEAAKALEQLEGKVLPGCLAWQKIKCQRLFHSSISCSGSVFPIIEKQLESLLASFEGRKGLVECILNKNDNGSYRVKISANATKTVAELGRPLEELMKGKPINDASLTPTILHLLFSRDGMVLVKKIQEKTGTFIFFDQHNLGVRVFGPPDKFVEVQKNLTESVLALNESKQQKIRLRGGDLPHDMMKQVVKTFGPELQGLKEKFPAADFILNTRYHTISFHGNKELKPKVEEILYGIAQSTGHSPEGPNAEATSCPICLCEVEDSYRLEACSHSFCRSCLVEQCESAMKSQDTFPICCTHKGCGAPILMVDLRSLLSGDKLEELFRAALGAYVASSGGTYRFCPSPDCPAVYRVADPGMPGEPFACGACFAETCTKCYLEYHPYISCERYREFKNDPDSSLKEWCKGKEHVKHCPVCGYTIEKVDGCNHIECRCGKHICWNCLEFYETSDDCYSHLRSIHQAII